MSKITFDKSSASRISAAVQRVEKMATPRADQVNGSLPGPSTFWAKITGASDDGTTYSWTRVNPDAAEDSGWKEDPRDVTGEENATPLTPAAVANDTIVLLHFVGYDEGHDPLYVFASPSQLFPVTVEQAEGEAGGPEADCSFTYDAKSLDGSITISDSPLEPKAARYAKCEYTAGTLGMAYYDAEGALQLMLVVDEIAKTDWVTVQTAWQVSGNKVQVKTRECLVLEAADESEWTDAHAGTTCA